jgi:hypothetical protein
MNRNIEERKNPFPSDINESVCRISSRFMNYRQAPEKEDMIDIEGKDLKGHFDNSKVEESKYFIKK